MKGKRTFSIAFSRTVTMLLLPISSSIGRFKCYVACSSVYACPVCLTQWIKTYLNLSLSFIPDLAPVPWPRPKELFRT